MIISNCELRIADYECVKRELWYFQSSQYIIGYRIVKEIKEQRSGGREL
jgi:hypothetical protein